MNPGPDTRIVLATASPRRRRLFGWLGLPFEITSVDTPEDMNSPLAENPRALAIHLAAEKAAAISATGDVEDAVVLCFDTIVVHAGRVLGKPDDVDHAWKMLRGLSGHAHQVVTGVAVLCPGAETVTTAVTTDVRMKDLSDDDIREWMSKGEFLGCAGAYNIEGQVAEVTAEECYQNVAGMPLCHLYRMIRDDLSCAYAEPTSPIQACNAALERTCLLGPRIIGD